METKLEPHGMLRPREFFFLTREQWGERYEWACGNFGFEPTEEGYAALLCEDDSGERFTIIGHDVGYLKLLVATPGRVLTDLAIPEGKFTHRRAGWPNDWPNAWVPVAG